MNTVRLSLQCIREPGTLGSNNKRAPCASGLIISKVGLGHFKSFYAVFRMTGKKDRPKSDFSILVPTPSSRQPRKNLTMADGDLTGVEMPVYGLEVHIEIHRSSYKFHPHDNLLLLFWKTLHISRTSNTNTGPLPEGVPRAIFTGYVKKRFRINMRALLLKEEEWKVNKLDFINDSGNILDLWLSKFLKMNREFLYLRRIKKSNFLGWKRGLEEG